MFKQFKSLFSKTDIPLINAGDYFLHYESDGPGLDKGLEWVTNGNMITLAMSERPEDFDYFCENLPESKLIRKGFGYAPHKIRGKVDLLDLPDYFDVCDFVGCIGIQNYRSSVELLHAQEEVFRYFLKAAQDHHKKAFINAFNSSEQVLKVMVELNARGHILLLDQVDQLEHFLGLDSYFVITPDYLVYDHFQTMIEQIPLSRLLTAIESYKTIAHSDQIEPSDVVIGHILDKIAEIKKLNRQEVQKQIYENYKALNI
ncbi:TatD family hydrolase [Fundicoccus culcitae]|uniref:TatD family hydrolase n=1 Tax=Fundicoccus culcitae TaxID=2969821 RepID=A0ABY5P8K4_9LACT|nr:TatD family hydrolase [Fundicoccus culcitae]UUX34805.1 TatD family hydrolase [Fundicoccus culcitae]